MVNPIQDTGLPPGWQELISWLEEATLWGTSARPMPEAVQQFARQLNVTLSADPVQAYLELMALVHPLEMSAREVTLNDLKAWTNRPAPEREWTSSQNQVLHQILTTPQTPGLIEASWLLQRNGWRWPEATIPDLLDLVEREPTRWADIGEAWPPLAQWLAHQLNSKLSSFPNSPPDIQRIPMRDWPVYLYRWLQLEPKVALQWMLEHRPIIPEESWLPWLELLGPSIHEGLLPLLKACTPDPISETSIHWLRARSQAGDVELIREIGDRVQPKVFLRGNTLELALPAGGPEWWWTGMPDQPAGFRRKTAFTQLVSCLPPDFWTNWFGGTPEAFVGRVFGSPDASTFVPAVYLQLVQFPDPKWCLPFLKHHLQQLHGNLPGPESALTRYIPSPDLAALIESEIRTSSYQLVSGSPAWNLLLSPHLFWTESLLKAVIHAFQTRPALAYEAAIDESFFNALAWRGSLSGLLRRSQRDGLKQVFPAPFSRLAPHILEVIEIRRTLHQALKKQ